MKASNSWYIYSNSFLNFLHNVKCQRAENVSTVSLRPFISSALLSYIVMWKRYTDWVHIEQTFSPSLSFLEKKVNTKTYFASVMKNRKRNLSFLYLETSTEKEAQ